MPRTPDRSRSWRSFAAAVTAVAACCALASPARAETTQLAVGDQFTQVDAFRGLVAWSHYDRDTERYRLRYRFEGRTRFADAPSRPEPFDLDLGPDERGSFLAVYSRCGRAPEDCDLYQYRFAKREERKLRAPSSERFSERQPTVWGSRIVFDRSGVKTPIRLGRRTAGGTLGIEGGSLDLGAFEQRPIALELRDRHLAFAWYAGTCEDGGKIQPDLTEMLLLKLDNDKVTGRRLVGRGCGGDDEADFDFPSLSEDALYYRFGHGDITDVRLRKTSLQGEPLATVVAPEDLDWYAQDGSTAYYVVSSRDKLIQRERNAFTERPVPPTGASTP